MHLRIQGSFKKSLLKEEVNPGAPAHVPPDLHQALLEHGLKYTHLGFSQLYEIQENILQ